MAVLRRAAGILLPARALEAEQALAGTWLHEGRPPWRAELLDPQTGEVVDAEPARLLERREQALEAWGGVLAGGSGAGGCRGLPGRTVGLACGRRAGLRRLGPIPLAGSAPTVKAFERQGAAVVTGLRAQLGEWKVFRWAEGELRFAGQIRAPMLGEHLEWLRERFLAGVWNGDVLRQELAARGVVASLRTVNRALKPFRKEVATANRTTVRSETPPGRQMQVDFGEKWLGIGGVPQKRYVFVATLGFSRRTFVMVFGSMRQRFCAGPGLLHMSGDI